MKKLIPILAAITMCFMFAACGNTTVSGDPVSYTNANKSFSIDLPTSSEEDWVTNEETSGDILDLTDSKDTIEIQVQCLSKDQAQYIASDLDSYREYSLVNTLADVIDNMELKDTDLELPDFVTDSVTQSFTFDDGSNTVKGVVAFMESDSSYYTYLIMAVEEAYDGNESALLDSLLSLKELTETPDDATSSEAE